jgi:hypothetical protein
MDYGSLVGGAVLGGVIAWLTAKHFYFRSLTDLQAGFNQQLRQLERQDTLIHFEGLVANGTWHKENINHQEVWVCQQKASFKIVPVRTNKPFEEPWTEDFPDPYTAWCDVELRINDSIVKVLTFVSVDGGRLLVPITKIIIVNEKPLYFWDKDSLEYKVSVLIGEFYIYKTIEGVAERMRVEILKSRDLPDVRSPRG